ncbi:MAG: S-methyl-5-thioribose-1-phosphate isomerase [Leptolyngbyaceae cyanobacterium SM2_5_2]|nr:S-methyl-5-thioribose-1-phosphate isomerase [Leptolyngbyaceae cyanobacterium SM2_5_2]
MKIKGTWYRSIRETGDGAIAIIDQRWLPHELRWVSLSTADQAAQAIAEMWTRGAPLLGVVGAYGLCFALRQEASDAALTTAYDRLLATRPTAVNLRWALDQIRQGVSFLPEAERAAQALAIVRALCEEEVETNQAIGRHGLELIKNLAAAKPGNEPVNILTHCNAGWLATVDWGTALAPIYMAHDAGIPVHVYVDETRPRNQGASLTAWELANHGVPFTLVVDNAGGHLMQHGLVDMCIVGTDRVTASGDVCNKIGTYLKALAAHDNGVPFYVALPYTTVDWTIHDGLTEIPIEQRSDAEITHLWGKTATGEVLPVQITLDGVATGNYGFDVTPGRLVTGLITERGLVSATAEGLATLYGQRTVRDSP